MRLSPVFRKKDFMLLWSGQLVSAIGTALHDLAMAWYVYELTGSTLAMSASIICSFLPRALVSPFAGVVADRYNRKVIIVTSDIVSGLVALMLYLFAAHGHLSLPAILAATAVLSMSSAFLGPAANAAMQSILKPEEYEDASSMRQLRFRFSSIVGALLGGFLLKAVGVRLLLLFNGVSFIVSALSESFITLPAKGQPSAPTNECPTHTLGEVVIFLKKQKPLVYLTILVMVVANGLFMCLFVYLPALFKDVFAATSAELGVYYAVEGLAATITALVLLNSTKKLDPYKSVTLLLFAEAIVLISYGLVRTTGAAYVLGALLGVVSTICVVMVMTVEQLTVPNAIMGRFTSVSNTVGDGAMPLFTLIFGFMGGFFPLQHVILGAGVLFFLALLPAPFLLVFSHARDTSGLDSGRIS